MTYVEWEVKASLRAPIIAAQGDNAGHQSTSESMMIAPVFIIVVEMVIIGAIFAFGAFGPV